MLILQEVIDRYSAKLEMLDSEEEVNASQEQLQTVLPAIGEYDEFCLPFHLTTPSISQLLPNLRVL